MAGSSHPLHVHGGYLAGKAEGTWHQRVKDVTSAQPSNAEVFARLPLLRPYTQLMYYTDHSQICDSEWTDSAS